MLSCHLCLRTALANARYEVSPKLISGADLRYRISRSNFVARRNHATISSIRKGHHRRTFKALTSKKGNQPLPRTKRRAAPEGLSKPEIRDSLARDRNKARLYRQTVAEEDEDEYDEAQDDDGPDDVSDPNLVRPSQMKDISKRDLKAAKQEKAAVQQERDEERRLVIKDRKIVETRLTDPLRLADAVLERLKKADINGALRYVHGSEALAVNNIVSWNHCIDWLMAQGHMKEAIRLYNDMKKRGRKPDSYTYTIMLRGLSSQVHRPNAVAEAIKVYDSMFAPNSAVKPNTIHTNAIVNVCARGGNMDEIWRIVGKMPDRGPGQPDRTTYTTILNAIREKTIREAAKLAERKENKENHDTTRLFEEALANARKVWEDISYRWRRADLIIDEHLVTAMGRILQGCGVGKDLEQVLDLVETTMNLRVAERRKTHLVNSKASESPTGSQSSEPKSNGEGDTQLKSGKSVMPLTNSNVYATPGPKTLSLLLDTLLGYKKLTHLAPAYWHKLTDPNGQYRIKPDAANIVAYLRILRVNHASTDAYELLSRSWPDEVAKGLYRRGSFVLAIRTCIRDINNPNVFRTAQKIIDLMQQKLEEKSVGMFDQSRVLSDMHGGERKKEIALRKQQQRNMSKEEAEDLAQGAEDVQSLPIDPKVLASFLNIAVRTTKGWNEGLRGKDDGEVFERDMTKNHTMIALQRIGPISMQLKRLMTTKLDELQRDDDRGRRDPRFKSRVGHDIQDLVDLIRTLISTCDRIVNIADRFRQGRRQELDPKKIENCNNWKRVYSFYMQKVEKMLGPHLFKKTTRIDDEAPIDDKPHNGMAEMYDDFAPQIEQQIRAAIGEADTAMLEARDKQKGRSAKHVSGISAPVLRSRVHKAQHKTQLEKAMKQRFPDLAGRSNKNTLPNTEQGSMWRNDASRSQNRKDYNVHHKSPSRNKTPMIGDELDLDNEDQKGSTVNWSPKQPQRKELYDIPFDSDQSRKPSRILNRPDVRGAWQGNRSSAMQAWG